MVLMSPVNLVLIQFVLNLHHYFLKQHIFKRQDMNLADSLVSCPWRDYETTGP